MSSYDIQKVKEKVNFTDYKYIIPVEGDAYSEVINHNNDETDPSRGTHSYSLEYFFSSFFPEGEYAAFRKYYDKYVKAVNAYFGISLVKTLRPNALFSYKQIVRDSLYSFDYQGKLAKYFPGQSLSPQQKAIIERQFYQDGYSNVLTGKHSFATCFMTAEWLYTSFSEGVGAIDLSELSMGYFKAIEQFLYDFIGFHTTEKDGKWRNIKFTKQDPLESFTDANYVSRKKDCTLGTMTRFVGHYSQRDLLRAEIDAHTKTIINTLYKQTSGLRNGYFHKDNVDNWGKVEEDRALAYLFFYFFLGSYKFEGAAKSYFEFVPPKQKDEFQKLCEYVHALSFSCNLSERPLIFLGDDPEHSPFYVPNNDKYIEYDEYGDPTYSGVYLSVGGQANSCRKLGSSNLPSVICKGRLLITTAENKPIAFTIIGPEQTIFKDGIFLGDTTLLK